MVQQIIDNHGRPLTYLRLSVTDRCNLRCSYCMPHEQMDFVPRKDLLTFEEMLRLVKLLATMGVKKIRITGGEPFSRKDIIGFLDRLSQIAGIEWHLTTNGVLTHKYISQLKRFNIKGINLSLDTLNARRFAKITRRDVFSDVMETFNLALKMDIPLKINTVVMKGINDDELFSIASLAKKHPVEVRFIEEMPFDGEGVTKAYLTHQNVLEILDRDIPLSEENFNSTAFRYSVKNWPGKIGIIPAATRSFCGSCNRIRINATGKLRTCLYGKDTLDLKVLLNSNISDHELSLKLMMAFNQRAKDGFEAERENNFSHPSMATIGG